MAEIPWRWVRLALASAVLIGMPRSALPARLATAQTTIEVGAGAGSPKLVTLGSGAGQWVNSASEKLIDSVWINGIPRAVQWKWNRRASTADALAWFCGRCAAP